MQSLGAPGSAGPRLSDSPAELLQRTLFSAAHPGASDDLYAVAVKGNVARERHRLLLSPHAEVTTETYFGRFPAAYFQRWTDVVCVEAVVTVVGPATVSLRASDADGSARTVAVNSLDTGGRQTLRLGATVDRFLDGGSLWVDIAAGPEEVVVDSVQWETPLAGRRRQTSVVICTFNRVSECLETMARLAADAAVMSVLEDIIVVDQGTQPVERHPRYAAVAEALGSKLHYLRQPNLGGAGGFSRGMYEVSGRAATDHAHVLLMDDDISLEPETVLRTTAFANRTTRPVIVGGQMLYLFHPEQLHISAETADLSTLSRGVAVPGAVEDVDVTQVLPHSAVDAGYNAWFSCLVPAEALAAAGLPLPCFIQWDDVEFGVRASKRGVPTVTLPGAAVWHADFTWKDGDDWASYFHFRNALIAAAVHGQLKGRVIASLLGHSLATMLAGYQYGLAETLIKAVDDFLVGPEVLADGGVAAAAEARALCSRHIESVRRTPAEMAQHLGEHVPYAADSDQRARSAVALPLRVVGQLAGRARSQAAFRTSQSTWWQISAYRTAVVTDAGRDALRIRAFDQRELRHLGMTGAMTLVRLSVRAAATQRRWQAAAEDLTARDNWRRLFQL